jgi:hypothetical protein
MYRMPRSSLYYLKDQKPCIKKPVHDIGRCVKETMTLCMILAAVIVTEVSVGRADDLDISRFSVEGLAGWTPQSFKGTTDYRLVNEDGRMVVKATSNAAASGLVKKIPFDPAVYRYLKWSWKIDHTIKGGDEKSKAGDDYAARIYVVFPGRFFWQTRAINYIWANILPQGGSIPNPYAAGAMMVAVESGPARAGQWMTEERDILADYRRLFGENPEEAKAIAIMTDTDNTGDNATAWYGEISVSTEP